VRKALLADAGPLYAAVDPSDKHHAQALRELQQFARRKYEMAVAFSTLAEAYSLILRKLGPGVALRWLNEMADAAPINPTPEDYKQATVKVARFADQSITLFDATVAVLAARLGLEVWTYDHRFDVMRVPVWR
jgi:predicted nucleic acid-binding protein